MANAFVTQVTLTPNRSTTLTAVNYAILAAQGGVSAAPGYVGISADSDTVITISAVDNDGTFFSTVVAIIIDNNDLKSGGTGLQTTLALTGASSKELHQVINSPFGYSIGIVELEYNTGAGINNKFFLLANNRSDRTVEIFGGLKTFTWHDTIVDPSVNVFIDLGSPPFASIPLWQNGYYLTLRMNQNSEFAPSTSAILDLTCALNVYIYGGFVSIGNEAIFEQIKFCVTPSNNASMVPASIDFWVQGNTFDITFETSGNTVTATGDKTILCTPTIQVNGYISAS